MKNKNNDVRLPPAINNFKANASGIMALVVVCLMIAMLITFSLQILKTKIQSDIDRALDASQKITLKVFAQEKNLSLETTRKHAQNDELIELTEQLISTPANNLTLKQHPSLHLLRKYFDQNLKNKGFSSFYIIAPGNINIASSGDSDLAAQNRLIAQPGLLKKLWAGQSAFTSIQPNNPGPISETQNTNSIAKPVTMVTAAPIFNANHKVIAILVLDIAPHIRLFPLLTKEHASMTGSTFAFDQNGLILTHSTIKNTQPLAQTKPRFTQFKADTTGSAIGKNIKGYKNGQGIEMVGAWQWLPEVGIGIATEQTLAEAYDTYYFTRKLVLIASTISGLLIIFLFIMTAIKRQQLKSSQAYLDAIYETSIDAIIITDRQGIIQKCNPATEQLFGYTATALIGQSVCLLMPEPYRNQHDNYMEKFHNTGGATSDTSVIGVVREYEAIKADGSLFPIEISVNVLPLSAGIWFAACIRDISQRKHAEHNAIKNQEHLISTLKYAQAGTWDWSRTDQTMSYIGNTAKIYGLEPEHAPGAVEMCSRPSLDFIQCVHPDDQDMAKNAVYSSSTSGNEFNIEYRVIWPDNSVHWINARGDVIFNDQGIPTNTMGILQDITQRKELEQELRDSEQALRESENHLSNILNTAPVNIYIKNLEGQYIFVNPAWKESVSLLSHQVLGKDDYELFNTEVAELHESTRQMAIKNKQAITFEEEILTRSGKTKSFMTSLFPLQDTQGKVYALGGWSAEITGLKKTQHDLELARQEADASSQAKSAFLATMSHEIRTPMNGVVGIVDVLKHSSLDSSQQNLVKTISDSSFALLGIIDDILDFSKIDAGKMELEQIPITLEEILDGVAETLMPLAAKKDIELVTFCDPALPKFYGDPVRIRQILYNISGNAIKFTESNDTRRGRVIMRCERPSHIGDMNTLILRIEDNGIGMPPQVQQRLFNPFSQAESSTTREFGGTGLGLTISKRLSEMMGGEIDVSSSAGKGTTFTVSLPLTPARTNPKKNESKLKNIPILFFNGDNVIDKILRRYLDYEELTLYDPASTELTNLIVDTNEPAQPLVAIIVDIQGNQGYVSDMQEQLRQQYAGRTNLHFILITQGIRRKPRQLGPDTLQLDINSLSRRVFLKTVAGAAGIVIPDLGTRDDKETTTSHKTLSSDMTGQTELLFLVAEDNPVNQRVIKHQLNLLGIAAEMANDGVEALKMWKSGNGKYDILLTDCHMPQMDGYNLARTIRDQQDPENPIPIIAITADAMKGTKQACLDAGMDDYITKPLQVDLLASKLDKWLPKTRSLNASTTEKPDQDTEEQAVIDPNSLPELLQTDDANLLTEFYHEFLKSAEMIIQEICSAVEEDNMKKTSTEAHKLKSSAYTIGANMLADCCLLLETSGKLGEANIIKENIAPLMMYFDQARKWIIDRYPNN
jgi:two-component system sensor histidine kinase/response regulator